MTVLRRLSVLLLAMCCCACSTRDAADVPQATPIPTPQVLEGLRRNEEGIPLLDVYLHEEETIRSMDIERYVCGVLAGEMRNDWPLEALKAQAILARTFVLKFVSEKESRYEGAEISTDITEAQAYNAAEINERIEQAVAETCGQVLLTASGELPYAWFHAHSGGKTALAREGLGWNDPEPTYTRVTDGLDSPEAPAEAAAWNAVFPVKQFLRACRATGADTETAEEVTIGEKGESGRAVTLLVDGVSVPAAELRLALGSTVMRSTLLTELSSDGAYVRMAGRGYGHGVGMPQWGAYALAEDGMAGEEIAVFYFDGVHVARLWDMPVPSKADLPPMFPCTLQEILAPAPSHVYNVRRGLYMCRGGVFFHEKAHWHSDQRRRLPRLERGHSRRRPGGL